MYWILLILTLGQSMPLPGEEYRISSWTPDLERMAEILQNWTIY